MKEIPSPYTEIINEEFETEIKEIFKKHKLDICFLAYGKAVLVDPIKQMYSSNLTITTLNYSKELGDTVIKAAQNFNEDFSQANLDNKQE